MGLPKNFIEVNKDKRQKALDDLEWFIFHYDYEMTEKYEDFVRVATEWGHPVSLGTHRCYADSEEKAITMFHEFMKSTYIDQKKFTKYELVYKNCDDGTCAISAVLN